MIHPRISLVTADYVATVRGVSVEAVYDLVDGDLDGQSLMWVFDIASGLNVKRELRFWSREISAPDTTANFTIEQVIRQIVPRRDALAGQFCGMRSWEVKDLLRVSKRMMLDLRDELQAENRDGGIYIPRHALENFFRRRWCYASTVRKREPALNNYS